MPKFGRVSRKSQSRRGLMITEYRHTFVKIHEAYCKAGGDWAASQFVSFASLRPSYRKSILMRDRGLWFFCIRIDMPNPFDSGERSTMRLITRMSGSQSWLFTQVESKQIMVHGVHLLCANIGSICIA